MSLENLQTLSKLKKICVHNFFSKKICVQPHKKSCERIFFWVWREFGDSPNSFFPFIFLKNDIKQRFLCEFGVSLDILQARSKLICFHCFLLFHCFFGKEEWAWSEFGDSSNSPQTRSKLICSFYFIFCGGKRGMSLEWVWRFSKLTSNSLQTQMISFFRVVFLYCFFHVCLEKTNDLGVSWEIIQTLPKLAPNSYVFIFSVVIFFSIYISFGQEEWVWSGFGDSSNSLQTHMFFLIILFFLWKRGMSLEWLWRFSKLSPNSLQTHVFFCYVTTEKTASPGSPAKLS